MTRPVLLAFLAASLGGCAHGPAPRASSDDAARARALADEYVAAVKEAYPELAEWTGLTLARHDRLSDNSLAALRAWRAREDAWLAESRRIDAARLRGRPEWVLLGFLRETLEASIATRPCRLELWPAHQFGWQWGFMPLLDAQPVATAQERREALARWGSLATYLDVEVANLKEGLRLGFTVPRRSVELAVEQLDGLLATADDHSPLTGPARRSGDPAFAADWSALLDAAIRPAIRRYRGFLAGDYLARARTTIAVSALPDGAACYRGLLRLNTTTDVKPEEMFRMGEARVAEREARFVELAREVYGPEVKDLKDAASRLKADPRDRLVSGEQVLSLAAAAQARAQAAAPRWFGRLPQRRMEVKPYEPFEAKSLPSARYEAAARDGSRPAYYRIDTTNLDTAHRHEQESTAFHEGIPGHHLQIALAQELQGSHELYDLASTAAFSEGWARYTETLADEMGLYSTAFDRLGALAALPTGMVVDPGVHVMGWTREQAIAFMLTKASGWSEKEAGAYVDRIAVWPGQMTSYGYGELAMLELRRLAERRLGSAFDPRAFHDRVLEQGALPLPLLREVVTAWIESSSRK